MEKTLVLIPTYNELKAIEPFLNGLDHVEVRLCGFGLVEASLSTIRECQILEPDNVVLCGIAGSYEPEQLQIGKTYCFESVSQYGIGCMRDEFVLPGKLGFDTIPQQLSLQPFPGIASAGQLVSVTSSGTFAPDEIRKQYPEANAEDMEGYGFALGAIGGKAFHISIVRSISNIVGEPFPNWKIDLALENLGHTLRTQFETSQIDSEQQDD